MSKHDEEIIEEYKIKYHKFDGKFYSDIFLKSGGYCIIQHSDKNKKVSRDKAIKWIKTATT